MWLVATWGQVIYSKKNLFFQLLFSKTESNSFSKVIFSSYWKRSFSSQRLTPSVKDPWHSECVFSLLSNEKKGCSTVNTCLLFFLIRLFRTNDQSWFIRHEFLWEQHFFRTFFENLIDSCKYQCRFDMYFRKKLNSIESFIPSSFWLILLFGRLISKDDRRILHYFHFGFIDYPRNTFGYLRCMLNQKNRYFSSLHSHSLVWKE